MPPADMTLRKWFIGIMVPLTVLSLTQIGLLVYWCGKVDTTLTFLQRQDAALQEQSAALSARLDGVQAALYQRPPSGGITPSHPSAP